jgi:AmmeMemoRadiSam system protein B
MSVDTQIPKLRTDMEIIPTYYQGQKALVVKDALGLIEDPVVLQGWVLDFIGLIDGRRNLRDIQLELIRQRKGVFVGVDEILPLLSDLDSLFLLDSEHYNKAKTRILVEYSEQKVRPAVLMGQAYPGSAETLRKYLNSFISPVKNGPATISGARVSALIAPHIDIGVGKKVYAQAYDAIKEVSPKVVVALGTGHSLHSSFFSLTEKDFETPFGLVKTERSFVQKLKEVGAGAVDPYDIDHRREHSIEFQLIFLQHLFGSDFSLIPVLCGSLHHALGAFSHASAIEGVKNVLTLLGRFVEERGSEVLVIAGVDFSHIGPKFGHAHRASSLILEAKEHDQRLIENICRGDFLGFWDEIKRVDNRYNVCGFSVIACLLELFPGSAGRCLGYDFWEEDETQSAVSFAAISLSQLNG